MNLSQTLTIVSIVFLFSVFLFSLLRIIRKPSGDPVLTASMLSIPFLAAVLASSAFVTSENSIALSFTYAAFTSLFLTGGYPPASYRAAIILLSGMAAVLFSFLAFSPAALQIIITAAGLMYYITVQLLKILSPVLTAIRFRVESVAEDMLRSCIWITAVSASFMTLLWRELPLQFPVSLLLFAVLLMNISCSRPGKMSRLLVSATVRSRKAMQPGMPVDSAEDPQKVLFKVIDHWLREERAFLRVNLSQEAVAEHFCTNRTYVALAVSRYSGMSYSDYINSIRIDYAISLAKDDPSVSVHRLSMMSGYPLPTTFSMAFKRRMGVNPGEWLADLRASKKKSVNLQPNK